MSEVVKKVAVIGVMMVVLLATNPVQAAASDIVNGSFENDGWLNDITVKEPNGWDVNEPAGKFSGYIHSDWPTEGSYNLTLYSGWLMSFDPYDMAAVSQEVDLTNANEIIFNLKLETYQYSPWDPNLFTAVVIIDNNTVWESNSTGSDVRGEYFDQSYIVEEIYKNGVHKLSFGLRANVTLTGLIEQYMTHWDFIECTSYCGGGGLLAADFNRDCYVDFKDLNDIAQLWLDEEVEPNNICNLFRGDDIETNGGIITFRDFAVFANNWYGDTADLAGLVEKWLQQVEIDDEYNLFTGDDISARGNINFLDFSVFAKDWWQSSYIEDTNEP